MREWWWKVRYCYWLNYFGWRERGAWKEASQARQDTRDWHMTPLQALFENYRLDAE